MLEIVLTEWINQRGKGTKINSGWETQRQTETETERQRDSN